VFGANIAGLVAGIAEAKESIEGLRAPVDDFVAGLSGVAEAIGAAASVSRQGSSFAISLDGILQRRHAGVTQSCRCIIEPAVLLGQRRDTRAVAV
jgi:hypothetical protein